MLLDGLGDGVEHGEPFVDRAPLAGRDAADDVRAVLAHLLGVERPGRAGDPLDDQLGLFSNENGHGYLLPLTSATIFCAPSAMSPAVVRARPDSASIFFAELDVRPFEAHDERHLEADLLDGGDDALGDGVALHDAAEDVDEDALHARDRR